MSCCQHQRTAEETAAEIQSENGLLWRWVCWVFLMHGTPLHSYVVHGGYVSSTLPPTSPHYPQDNKIFWGEYCTNVMSCSRDIFPAGDPIPVQRCIVSGFFANAARLHYTGCYRLEWALTNWLSMLPLFEPHSVMRSLWCLFSPPQNSEGGSLPLHPPLFHPLWAEVSTMVNYI